MDFDNTSSADPESELRENLVEANRILVRHSVLDAFGHVSARMSHHADTFLLSRSLAPGSVASSDFLVHDMDGRTEGGHRAYVERFIHAEIYRRRPDVSAIVHSHSMSVIPFTVSDVPLRPVFHMAGFLGAGAPIFEISDHAGQASDLLVTSSPLGESLARTLEDSSVALMRGHGFVAVGATIPEAVYRAVYTQVNAQVQQQALVLGAPRFLNVDEAASADASVRSQVDRAWSVWRAELDTGRRATDGTQK